MKINDSVMNIPQKGVASKMKPCVHFDSGVCYSPDWEEPFGEGCLLNHKDSCPHYSPTTLMTGKDKLMEYLVMNMCQDRFKLNRLIITCKDDSRCAECWKLALEEEFNE